MSSSTTTLTSWVKNSLTNLFESSLASEEEIFQTSFESIFSPHAQIISNHERTTADAFKENILNRAFAATRVSVNWKEVFEVPNAEDAAHQTGIVAGCIVVTRSLKFRIRAAPAQSNWTMVFSARVESEPSIQNGDPRRIVEFIQTSFDMPAPIHLQGIPAS
ncbi:hypothetical protein Hypma_012151 [Hypsizygus marmoreus]|uniref:Uncharacterized protein n=1 Tax=Hypsizygus marmoreus TaxID=39966 RepID=A0A369JJ32_HYPMA|nr:hypothetical protein Hypma_012151 [Hypsizygus marmoreus]